MTILFWFSTFLYRSFFSIINIFHQSSPLPTLCCPLYVKNPQNSGLSLLLFLSSGFPDHPPLTLPRCQVSAFWPASTPLLPIRHLHLGKLQTSEIQIQHIMFLQIWSSFHFSSQCMTIHPDNQVNTVRVLLSLPYFLTSNSVVGKMWLSSHIWLCPP